MPCEVNNNRSFRVGRRTHEPYLGHGRVEYFGSGREALISLTRALGLGPCHCVLLPAYMPEGIFRPFDACHCRIIRYQLNENLDPIWDVLEKLLAQESPVVAVLIHYFGLEKDAARFAYLCRQRGALMVEDMAHILPGPSCTLGRDGDYVLYSPTKVVGVPDGGIMVCRSPAAVLQSVRSVFNVRRVAYLYQQVGLLSIATLARNFPAGRWLALVRRLTARLLDSYSSLMSYYQTPHRASWLSRWLLRRCEWGDWAAQRQAHSDSYAAGLDPRVFRQFQGKCPVGGGPFAFPVLVSDREELQRFLGEFGISGLTLTSRWDFIPDEERSQHPATVHVLREHFLFPTSQTLSRTEVARVIALANQWASTRLNNPAQQPGSPTARRLPPGIRSFVGHT